MKNLFILLAVLTLTSHFSVPYSGAETEFSILHNFAGAPDDGRRPVSSLISDGSTLYGIFRSSSGLWAIRDITRVYFGRSGDTPVTR
ncbi:MAG: hypothetical protein U9N73_02420 [Candidatus Auribacterota bacterium]|nr:hypothetical protein [Candidatus Auribacterota bacterium]